MAVAAFKEYTAVPRDLVANLNGKQIVYASWDRHLLFAGISAPCCRIANWFPAMPSPPSSKGRGRISMKSCPPSGAAISPKKPAA